MSEVHSSLVILGGTLIDGTGNLPVNDSIVVIENNRIVSVGKRNEVEMPANAKIIDCSGKTVLPGFIDSHCHLFWNVGVDRIRYLDLNPASSLNETLNLVKNKVQSSPRGEWILATDWDDSKWSERRYITKEDLDPFSRTNPVMLIRICGHLVSVNSMALQLAGINKDTPDPAGGSIGREVDGQPNGVLFDARQLIEKVTPPVTDEVALNGLTQACALALSLGCTGIHDPGLDALGVGFYKLANDRNLLKIRAYLMAWDDPGKWVFHSGPAIRPSSELRIHGTDRLKLGPVKFVFDGSEGAKTAALFEPYCDDPTTNGLLMMDPEVLRVRVREAHIQGLQVAIHAIGDRAIEYALDAIESAVKEMPRQDHRHRIEHCSLPTIDQIKRIKHLGIIASMQPNFTSGLRRNAGSIGQERTQRSSPHRFLLDEGVKIAFGSDGIPFNPLYGIDCALNHPIKESSIILEEAVKCYTLNGAFASFNENLKGSIESGKLADVTILKKDLTKVQPNKIKDVPVSMTIVNGEILYVG